MSTMNDVPQAILCALPSGRPMLRLPGALMTVSEAVALSLALFGSSLLAVIEAVLSIVVPVVAVTLE
jgi:hypothetical protein